jgi:hypothetical protein
MTQIDTVVSQLQDERKELLDNLSRIDHALKLLRGTNGAPSGGRRMSAAARAKLAAAQRALWAKWNAKRTVTRPAVRSVPTIVRRAVKPRT